MNQLSRRSRLIKPSVTLAIAAKAGKLRAEGVDIINFSAGEPDFDTPASIKQAAIDALARGMTKYTDVRGIEPLRAAVAEKYRREYGLAYSKDEVLVSCGAKHALYNVIQAIVDDGDEVLIPAPFWVSYADIAVLAGGKPRLVRAGESAGFRISAEALEAALTPEIRLVILNSPCNPTGATYSRDELARIARVLEKRACWLLSDDIYEKIVYDDFQFNNIVALNPALRGRTVIINGVSKTYSMTGWRIGYALGPAEVMSAAAKIQSQSTSNPTSIAQAAALEAISGPQETVAAMVREFATRRDLIVERLNAVPGVRCLKPEGAFYVFPNVSALFGKTAAGTGKKLSSPCDVAEYLLERARVATVPGEDFGSFEHIRFSYATSLDDIEEGCRRIRLAVEQLE
ncbi:MAG TPA: pyridoxal phosphate-dependent aminotransferase [Candidatus Eisenbacteria bacterium]|nr:pyridoxal phosphate-dependent aminotransferase [Candidatus Eisenbacteria bacterium]